MKKKLMLMAMIFIGSVAFVYSGGCGSETSLDVASVSPAADATDVAVTTVVTATFSSAVSESTITDSTFTLVGAGDIPVGGTVTYDAATRTATFTPNGPLNNWMTYTATITTGVSTSVSAPANTSMNKASLSSDYTWEFATVSRGILYESRRATNGDNAAIVAAGTGNIWVMDADGSNSTPLTQLINLDTQSSSAQWSPDGTQVAFDSQRDPNGNDVANANNTSNIWVMNADGSSQTALTILTFAGADAMTPVWSPDGTKIMYSSARKLDGSNDVGVNASNNIWVMDADGSNDMPLSSYTAAGASCGQGQWSPDGTQITFLSTGALDGSDAANANGTMNIWTMDADGSNPTPLTELTALNAGSLLPRWSPDGTRIVFMSTRDLNGSDAASANVLPNCWVMDADGSNQAPLTNLTAVNAISMFPEWSPDGLQVTYTSSRALDGSDAPTVNVNANIWVTDADGATHTPLTQLTANNANSTFSVWRQDGSKILYVSSRDLDGSNETNLPNSVGNVWSMDVDGANAEPFTSLTAVDTSCMGIDP